MATAPNPLPWQPNVSFPSTKSWGIAGPQSEAIIHATPVSLPPGLQGSSHLRVGMERLEPRIEDPLSDRAEAKAPLNVLFSPAPSELYWGGSWGKGQPAPGNTQTWV